MWKIITVKTFVVSRKQNNKNKKKDKSNKRKRGSVFLQIDVNNIA